MFIWRCARQMLRHCKLSLIWRDVSLWETKCLTDFMNNSWSLKVTLHLSFLSSPWRKPGLSVPLPYCFQSTDTGSPLRMGEAQEGFLSLAWKFSTSRPFFFLILGVLPEFILYKFNTVFFYPYWELISILYYVPEPYNAFPPVPYFLPYNLPYWDHVRVQCIVIKPQFWK